MLRKLLLTGTIEVSFDDHLGNIDTQKDGVSTGSVPGSIFSNSNMFDLKP